MPDLTHEDLQQLREKTLRLIDELQPRNQAELDQVCQQARLTLVIERADRFEMAHMNQRIRAAARQRVQEVNPRLLEVEAGGCELKTPRKASNEANLVSMQGTDAQWVESQKADPEGRERSQSAAGGRVVRDAGGYDSPRLMEDSTNREIGTFSPEGADEAVEPCLSNGPQQSLDDGEKTPQKASNEANLPSTQSMIKQYVASNTSVPEGRERSQSAAGEEAVRSAGNDQIESIMPAVKDGEEARVRTGLFSPETASQNVVPEESGPPVAGTNPPCY